MKAPQFFGIREATNADFSSGPENRSSPEYADNEDTPEPKRGSQADISDNVTVQRGHKSPSKRQSFSEMFSFRRFSPGRSGFRKRHDREPLAKKVHKRKRRELEKDDRMTYRRPSDDSSSDDPSRQSAGSTTGPQDAFFPALIKIIVDHPSLPHVLAFYVQLLWNLFLCFFFMYILYSFWATIRQDVNMKAEESVAQTLADMAICANEYVQNRCDRESRVPAMETLCDNWENCMNRDPHKVARARISAHTFAEIFNSFIEPITFKAMVCPSTHLSRLLRLFMLITTAAGCDLHSGLRLLRHIQLCLHDGQEADQPCHTAIPEATILSSRPARIPRGATAHTAPRTKRLDVNASSGNV